EANDYDVWGLSRCNDEVETPRENENDENFDDFDLEHIDGKTFETQETAYEFYNQYALLNGFGAHKHNVHKIKATGAIFRRQFGYKKLDDKRLTGNEKRHRVLRTGCKAMMHVTLSKKLGVWVFNKFQDFQNHPLTTTASKVVKHLSTIVQIYAKSPVSDLNNEGLKPSQIARVVNVMKPSEEADATPRQYSSIVRVERKIKVGKECYGIIKHFQEKATLDDIYYFAVDLAIDGSLRSVFWADGRSRASYAQFGDFFI
ncbi:hypothetical protein RJ639_018262, partial [Escallonia herrerae]